MPLVRALLLLLVVALTGCPGACSQEMDHGGNSPDSDAGASSDPDAGGAASPCGDAGPQDASPYDASPYDAGLDAAPSDASPYDAGPLDAGDPCNADAGPDAGS